MPKLSLVIVQFSTKEGVCGRDASTLESAVMHPFEERLTREWPPRYWRDVTVLVAVSGGPDSVALLRGLAKLRRSGDDACAAGTLCAAHLNHQLRGDESAADEQFVVDFCRNLGVPCEVGQVELAAALTPSGGGLETVARQARYRFLEQAAERCGARYVALAHTADDQAETILHRIVRGTGLAGLGGMTRVRPLGHASLVRPLLGFRRNEVVSYLADLAQPFRVDQSNADLRFTRNRIRHDLLPRLAREYNPNVADALVRLGALAGELHAWTAGHVEPLLAACSRFAAASGEGVHLDSRRLHSEPAVLVRELLMVLWRRQDWPMQQMGFDQWERMAEMVRESGEPSSQCRRHTFPGGILAEAGPEGLLLRPSR